MQTDLTPINREQAPLTPDQAATVIVTAATLPSDAPSGRFIDHNGPVAPYLTAEQLTVDDLVAERNGSI